MIPTGEKCTNSCPLGIVYNHWPWGPFYVMTSLKEWRSWGLPWVSHFRAASHSITQTYPLRKSTIIPLQKPGNLPYSLLQENIRNFCRSHSIDTSVCHSPEDVKASATSIFSVIEKGALTQICGFTAAIVIIIFKRCNIYIKMTQLVICSKDKCVFMIWRSVIYNYFVRHKQSASVLF